MIRTVIVWTIIISSLLVLGTLVILAYPFSPSGRIGHRFGRLWAKVSLLGNRVTVKVEGLENLKGEGPYVFMANHQGTYDIFALLGHLPFQFRWLVKKELFSVPYFGWIMAAAGYVSVDREGTRETVDAMNLAAKKIQEGMSLAIFPEGSRSPDGSIQPFKKGGFTLAIKSKAPIVPVTISGTREIMPKDRLTVRPGKIRIRIGPPIETERCSSKDRIPLMEKVHHAISRDFGLLSQGGSD